MTAMLEKAVIVEYISCIEAVNAIIEPEKEARSVSVIVEVSVTGSDIATSSI
jgi:hypothetical protein